MSRKQLRHTSVSVDPPAAFASLADLKSRSQSLSILPADGAHPAAVPQALSELTQVRVPASENGLLHIFAMNNFCETFYVF